MRLLFNLRTMFIVILLMGSFTMVFAQPGDPGGDPDVPITGIEILLGIGGLYGAKKALDRRPRRRG